jgi:alpha-tubulin suppressor-like RCC1 family protein
MMLFFILTMLFVAHCVGVSDTMRRLSCGAFHSCLVTRANATRCWGVDKPLKPTLGFADVTQSGTGFPGSKTIRAAGDVDLGADLSGSPVLSAHTGDDVSCVLVSGGHVRCWGFAASPVLAAGRTDDELGADDAASFGARPVAPPALRNVTQPVRQLALGRQHACALLENATLFCWGDNSALQLGVDDRNAMLGVVPLWAGVGAIAMLSAGQSHSCVLSVRGDVYCWGSNLQKQLGVADAAPLSAGRAALVPLPPSAYAYLASGARHSCAVSSAGALHCWGSGELGRLGYGNDTPVAGIDDSSGARGLSSLPAVPFGAGKKVSAVACGSAHTCALFVDGGVRCFGLNSTGRLGFPTNGRVGSTPSTTPDKFRDVELPLPAIAVSAGDEHTCALLSDLRVYCWGFGPLLGYNNASVDVGSSLTVLPSIVGPVDIGDDAPTTTAPTTTSTATATTMLMTSAGMERSRGILTPAPEASEFPWWAILIIVLAVLCCCLLLLLLLLLLRRRRRASDEDAEQQRRATAKRGEGEPTAQTMAFTAGTVTKLDAVAQEAGADSSSSSSSAEPVRKPKSKKKKSSKKRHA